MNGLTRREFIARTPLATVALYALTTTGCRSEESQFVDVGTGYGKLRGIRDRGVNIYKGVPYTGRVSGDRRFRSPAPLEPWTGVRDAL